jgi:A/G-specific adenine glycosylase
MRGEFSVFRQSLLEWFQREKRDLPWRVNPSLYGTVVSEFMLQQTQVETVQPYYIKWIRRFPDFEAVAKADERQLIKMWEGLGYYSRVRNLHKLAISICESGIPTTLAEWLKRPGVGPYTAAAICSIAQNIAEPVIDGNVIRVLCRINNDDKPIRSAIEGRKRLISLTRNLIDPDSPGDFNEAIMELGAMVCRKYRPACLLCPVREHCCACAAGNESRIPVLVKRSTKHVTINRLWILQNDCLLLHLYPDDSNRLAGLAELPQIDAPDGIKHVLKRTRGISTERITEYIFSLDPSHPCAVQSIKLKQTKWVPVSKLACLSISGPHKRWISELLNKGLRSD